MVLGFLRIIVISSWSLKLNSVDVFFLKLFVVVVVVDVDVVKQVKAFFFTEVSILLLTNIENVYFRSFLTKSGE